MKCLMMAMSAEKEHANKAAEHAVVAGEWDESKHPRDENGKFGG